MSRARSALRVAAAGFSVAISIAMPSARAAPTGYCDVSPGEYTAWTGSPSELDTAPTSAPGVSEARCLADIRSLGGLVEENVFKDAKGRYANELPTYGKLVNMWPGEPGNSVCNTTMPVGKRNAPFDLCTAATYTSKPFAETAAAVASLDWKFANPIRYNSTSRAPCPAAWPPMGCYADRCYDAECVNADGTLKSCASGQICKKGVCEAGSATSLLTCRGISNAGATGTKLDNGNPAYYEPWNALVFDLGGLASKVAIFALIDHAPQPCESIEYTVYLTNNPASRLLNEDPAASGPDPKKWNRAKLNKIYTHGWIDNPDCCATPKGCDPAKCALPKPGDSTVFEGDAMTSVYALPCGISFRYAAIIAGYDGKSLDDPTKGADRCTFHSFDAEVDAVAGLTEDDVAICPDKDGDGFPTCECAGPPCDCIDDPSIKPDAAKYHPGAAQSCDGPQYSCAPTPCPTGTVCANSQCLRPCDTGEFKCPSGSTCSSVSDDAGAKTDVCLPAPCGDAGTCAPGSACVAGTCVDVCTSTVKCPPGNVCKEGGCFDPCALVTCPTGLVCQQGTCVFPCGCLKSTAIGYPCLEPLGSCDKASNKCVPNGCDKTKCPTGTVCVGTASGPACKGPCEDVVCPGRQVCDPVKGCVDKCALLTSPCAAPLVCYDGACVDKTCVGVDCSAPFVCREGKCVEGDAGLVFDASSDDTGTADDDASIAADAAGPPKTGAQSPDKDSGCRCSSPGARVTTSLAALGGAAFALAIFARRRRQR